MDVSLFSLKSQLGCAVFLFACTTANPSVGEARLRKKGVVVMPFSGPTATKVRARLVRKLKRRFRLISAKSYQRVADQLGVSGRRPSGMKTICTRLKASAVLRGSVKRRRRGRYRVTVTVYSGATGLALGNRNVTVRGRRRLRRAGATLGARTANLINQGSYNTVSAPVPQPVVRAQPQADPPTKSNGQRRDGDTDDDDDDAGDDDDADDVDNKAGTPDGLFAVAASLGVASRNYTLDTGNKITDRSYSGLYPEFTMGLEAYPLALLTKGFASGFGLGLSYSRHLSISTERKETGQSVDTSSSELLVNLRYRWLISGRTLGAVAYGFVGYGLRSFGLGTNAVLTSFDYSFFQLGIGGRLPLWGDLLGAELQGSIRPVLTVGQEAVEAFGKKDSSFGWSLRAGVSGGLPFGLFYFLNTEFIGFSSSFEGVSSQSSEVDVLVPSNGSDLFVRFWLGAGYRL